MTNTGDNSNTGDKEKEAPVNTNGGNTASNSSGEPFSGYNDLLLPFVLRFLLLSVAMLLRCLVYVDAYFILSTLILYTFSTATRSSQIANVMLKGP
uniref:Retrotransposon protein, putative, Ty1-copia subclass n=1 Tax=Oryza sativa subsp. japonica TaxID=39947 RepID=Q2QX69_ORYSJ|nr:retrotransposon protein, putative, Ty1-copia subclass [Oryza sativa Japonica Group]